VGQTVGRRGMNRAGPYPFTDCLVGITGGKQKTVRQAWGEKVGKSVAVTAVFHKTVVKRGEGKLPCEAKQKRKVGFNEKKIWCSSGVPTGNSPTGGNARGKTMERAKAETRIK